jgi:hypothetical protein
MSDNPDVACSMLGNRLLIVATSGPFSMIIPSKVPPVARPKKVIACGRKLEDISGENM